MPEQIEEITPEQEAIALEQAQRSELRQKIQANAGDISSILGTTADATQILLFGLASLVAKLSTAQSLAEVREAAAPFADISADFLTKIESGAVKLPFQVKGTENVIADIETRATAVAETLITLSE